MRHNFTREETLRGIAKRKKYYNGEHNSPEYGWSLDDALTIEAKRRKNVRKA